MTSPLRYICTTFIDLEVPFYVWWLARCWQHIHRWVFFSLSREINLCIKYVSSGCIQHVQCTFKTGNNEWILRGCYYLHVERWGSWECTDTIQIKELCVWSDSDWISPVSPEEGDILKNLRRNFRNWLGGRSGEEELNKERVSVNASILMCGMSASRSLP